LRHFFKNRLSGSNKTSSNDSDNKPGLGNNEHISANLLVGSCQTKKYYSEPI
jgi:hypothetical protein